MAWSVISVLVLAAAIGALTWRRRARATARPGPGSEAPHEPKPSPTGTTRPTGAEGPETPAPTKRCPACLSEYAPKNRYCVRDGAELIDGRTAAPFSQGMICPTCRRGYPIDAGFCPEDADELVPYGLFGAASSTRPPIRPNTGKICPECGVRHAPTHLFCGEDGAELVVVN